MPSQNDGLFYFWYMEDDQGINKTFKILYIFVKAYAVGLMLPVFRPKSC